MKSLRTIFTLSMLIVNILVILLIGFSILAGFFAIAAEWESKLTHDITVALNKTISEKYKEVKDLSELSEKDFIYLIDETLKIYQPVLRRIRFISNNGELIYNYNTADSKDSLQQNSFKPELIRWTADIRPIIFKKRPDYSGKLFGKNLIEIGKIEIASRPLMGNKFSSFFDTILTTAILRGMLIAILTSVIISFLLSRRLSRHSKTFAEQLTQMADGNREINFTGGSSTEMKSAAAAAEILQHDLKHNENLQQTRLQDIVHDLRTPVSALGIQFEAIQDGILQVNNERIEVLSAEFKRIEEMITELSKYTKLKSEDYLPIPTIFDANLLIKETIAKFELQIQNKEQCLRFVNPRIPSLIESDRLGLMRVLNNLIINAINNAPTRTEIKISIFQHKNNIICRDLLTIEIENEGRIEDKDLPFIFDRLYRSKNSGYHGSGLGLAISKAIVEKNCGKISVINTISNTVIFRIELPVTVRRT